MKSSHSPTEFDLSHKYSEIGFEDINFRYVIRDLVYPLSVNHAKSTFATFCKFVHESLVSLH
jgi:hypothetical protein